MSELNQYEEDEIVDLDTCSKRKSILIAVVVTAVLGLVPYSYMLLCFHYVIGGIAATGLFAKQHCISFSGTVGAKLGALSSFLGMLVVLLFFVYRFYTGFTEEDFEPLREQILQTLYEDGQPEAAEYAETMTLEQVRPLILGALVTVGSVVSLLLGALGGVIGSALFKRGPEAK